MPSRISLGRLPLGRLPLGRLPLVAAGLALLVTGCGQRPGDAPGPGVGPAAAPVAVSPAVASTAAERSCYSLARSLSPAEQAGQVLMVAVPSSGLPAGTARLLSQQHVGSVILLGNSTAGVARVRKVTNAVRRSVHAPAHTKTLLAGDQEGGLVQRFSGPGFNRIPSASRQAKLSDAELRRQARVWGTQLRKAGIDVNLAPVADVVPASLGSGNAPIGALHRGYGSNPSTVARKVVAFSSGMKAARVSTTVKHFPGLGRVRGNTDVSANVIDHTTTRHDRYLAGFTAAVRDHVDLVMISSAIYARINRHRPATFSHTVIAGMVRHDANFKGVIISDDLDGKALQGVGPGTRVVRFVAAGGDLAIVGQASEVPTMTAALRRQAAKDPAFAQRLTAATTHVLRLKARQGLADCSG